ncbi:hypothetical protein VTK56DRAFT_3556 [Thermocarpiscus australiensis]
MLVHYHNTDRNDRSLYPSPSSNPPERRTACQAHPQIAPPPPPQPGPLLHRQGELEPPPRSLPRPSPHLQAPRRARPRSRRPGPER